MNKVRSLPLNEKTLASIDFAAIERKVQAVILSGVCCEGCDKSLSQPEQELKGYASGNELGLCYTCASDVNTPEAVDYAVKLGRPIRGPVVLKPRSNTGFSYSKEDEDV